MDRRKNGIQNEFIIRFDTSDTYQKDKVSKTENDRNNNSLVSKTDNQVRGEPAINSVKVRLQGLMSKEVNTVDDFSTVISKSKLIA